jgi:gliding motility-associated lipoprotein GldH
MKLRQFIIQMSRKSITAIGILISLSIIHSCDKSIMYEENRHLGNSEWKAGDTLFFDFEVKDSLQAYDFGFTVRNTTSYSYQNLYLFITAWYPDGNWSRDTAECILAAPDGKWFGKGMGKIRDSQFIFRKTVQFRRSGHYTIGVNQAMRIENLKGISDIGIRLTKSGN